MPACKDLGFCLGVYIVFLLLPLLLGSVLPLCDWPMLLDTS